jgi:hypothetical protein
MLKDLILLQFEFQFWQKYFQKPQSPPARNKPPATFLKVWITSLFLTSANFSVDFQQLVYVADVTSGRSNHQKILKKYTYQYNPESLSSSNPTTSFYADQKLKGVLSITHCSAVWLLDNYAITFDSHPGSVVPFSHFHRPDMYGLCLTLFVILFIGFARFRFLYNFEFIVFIELTLPHS